MCVTSRHPQVTGRAYVNHPVLGGFEPVWMAYTGLLVMEHHAHHATERPKADRPRAPEAGAAAADTEAVAVIDHAPLQPWAEWAWGVPMPLAQQPPPTTMFSSLVLACIRT